MRRQPTPPPAVVNGIGRVRESGLVNMFDRRGAMVVASDLEEYEAVVWMNDNPAAYGEFILYGVPVADNPEGESDANGGSDDDAR